MAGMTPLIHRLLPADATAAFCARWGVSELYVFGSAARGELRDDSDLDVAVRFRPGMRYSLFELVDMKEELSAIAGRAAHLAPDVRFEPALEEADRALCDIRLALTR